MCIGRYIEGCLLISFDGSVSKVGRAQRSSVSNYDQWASPVVGNEEQCRQGHGDLQPPPGGDEERQEGGGEVADGVEGLG